MNRRNEYSGPAGQGPGSQQTQQRYSQDWTDDDYRSGRSRTGASYEEDYDVRSGSDDRYIAGGRSYERGHGNQGGMRGSEEYGNMRGMAPRSQSQPQHWGYGEYDSERQTSYGRGPAGNLGSGYGGMSGGSYEGGHGGGNMGQNRFGAPRSQSMDSHYGRENYQGNYVPAGSWNDESSTYAQRGGFQRQPGQWGGTQGMRSNQWGEPSANYNQAGGAFGQAGNYGPGAYASGSYGASGYGQTNYWGQPQGGNPDPYGYGRGGSDIGYGSNYGSVNYGAGAGYGNYGPSGRPGGGFGGSFGGGMSGSGSGLQPGGYQSQGTSGYAQGTGQRNFSGRGPKGYARSDERLKEDINERLTDDPLIDASDVSVEVRDGKVTLTGQVDERWLKHSIEDLVDRCAGVKDIDNRLTVAPSRSSSTSGTTASGSGTSTGSSSFSGQGDGDSFTSSTSRSTSSTTTGPSPSSTSTSTKKN